MPAGASVADVGTGDGKLAAYLAEHGHHVVATENKPGPRAQARNALDRLGIECRLGEGLNPILPGEVEVAVIAGLGGRSMLRMLAASPAVVAALTALVLQPVQHTDELLAGLAAAGYRLEAQREIAQGRHRYLALRFVPPYSTAG